MTKTTNKITYNLIKIEMKTEQKSNKINNNNTIFFFFFFFNQIIKKNNLMQNINKN